MKFFKKPAIKKVDLPANWPLVQPTPPPPAKPQAVIPKRVLNLSEPPVARPKPKTHKQITTPVPAKLGTPTLNLTGKKDAFTRRSANVVDMRQKPQNRGTSGRP